MAINNHQILVISNIKGLFIAHATCLSETSYLTHSHFSLFRLSAKSISGLTSAVTKGKRKVEQSLAL